MKHKTKQVLETAANTIAEKRRWTQGSMARDADGKAVEPENPKATCFCAFGAIRLAYEQLGVEVEPSCMRMNDSHAMQAGSGDKGSGSFITFNDQATHAEVKRMFERAIDWADERGL